MFSARTPLTVSDWNPTAIKISQVPNNKNSTTIKKYRLSSDQQGSGLTITTPKMQTWGIQDFKDKKTGESDGKFKLSLNFPIDSNPETEMFKEKMEQFYNKVIDLVEANSPSFFGKKKVRESIIDSSFPILKYPKIKESSELDYSKPPALSVKVENFYSQEEKKYTDHLDVHIYDRQKRLLYPNEDTFDHPSNHVGKLSTIVALLKCNSIWVGATNWGITFSVTQIIVVNPGDNINSSVCQIKIDDDEEEDDSATNESESITKQSVVQTKPIVTSTFVVPEKKGNIIKDDDEDEEDEPDTKPSVFLTTEVKMDDDDDDEDDDEEDEPVVKPPPPPAVVTKPAGKATVVKRIIKKT
jgi:hypothetical protein